MTCHDINDTVEAYVLGALDRRETAAIDAHLATCADCRARVESYCKVLDGMLADSPVVEPPPGHRERFHARLVARVAAERTTKSRRLAFPRLPVLTGIAAAILLVATIGLSLLATTMSSELATSRANFANAQATISRVQSDKATAQATLDRLTRESADVRDQLTTLQTSTAESAKLVNILTQPGITLATVNGTTDAPTAVAHVVMTGNSTTGAVLARNWPGLPSNKVYQLWYLPRTQGTASIPGQAFTLKVGAAIGDGAFLFDAPDTMEHYRGIGITIEPPGGSPRPTSPIYLLSDFQ